MDFRQYQYVLKVAELGAKLFNRNTTPLSLTSAGEAYVETARIVLSLNDKMKKAVQDIAMEKKGVITIGISNARKIPGN